MEPCPRFARSSAGVARASIARAATLAGVSTAEVADIVVSLATSNP